MDKNQWLKDLSVKIADECGKHNKGFVFIPFSETPEKAEENDKNGEGHTCLATSMKDEFSFCAALTSAIENFSHHSKNSMSSTEMASLINAFFHRNDGEDEADAVLHDFSDTMASNGKYVLAAVIDDCDDKVARCRMDCNIQERDVFFSTLAHIFKTYCKDKNLDVEQYAETFFAGLMTGERH